MKTVFFTLLFFISSNCFSQYIGVKARYTETRLVDDSPNPPRRENRLILSFFEVTASGQYIPVALSNYDIWVYKAGLQYGSLMGGVLDSTGNNYPGYAWPAPKAVAYYNSYNPHYIDCDPNAATHYIVNGHELDCGFITVSYWDIDYGTGNAFEAFPAPNVCLPYYIWPHPYAFSPGNVNFNWPVPATAPYNWYSFLCAGSSQQLVIRGVLAQDSSLTILPVRFDNVNASVVNTRQIKIAWSNMTESDINYYEIERSADGNSFQTIGLVFPRFNDGRRADYEFFDNTVSAGNSYLYRIKALEISGSYLYSSVLRVNINIANTLSSPLLTYPNPVSNHQLTLQLNNAAKGHYTITLVNAAGQSIVLKEMQHTGGSITQVVNLPHSLTGMYYLIVQSSTEIFSKKIFIKN